MACKNHRITVALIGSGFAALLIGECNDNDGLGEYTDVIDTGIGRYATREEAVREAKSWSASDEIPLDPSVT